MAMGDGCDLSKIILSPFSTNYTNVRGNGLCFRSTSPHIGCPSLKQGIAIFSAVEGEKCEAG